MGDAAKIKLEVEFANAAYQDFKSKRFGLTACCYYDLQAIYIKKQCCSWEEKKASCIPGLEGIETELSVLITTELNNVLIVE